MKKNKITEVLRKQFKLEFESMREKTDQIYSLIESLEITCESELRLNKDGIYFICVNGDYHLIMSWVDFWTEMLENDLDDKEATILKNVQQIYSDLGDIINLATKLKQKDQESFLIESISNKSSDWLFSTYNDYKDDKDNETE